MKGFSHLLLFVNDDLSSYRTKCHSQNVPETHTLTSMLQLSSALFRPMHICFPAVGIAGTIIGGVPTPFGCTVVIGEVWVFFFIVTFISAGQ